MIPEYITRMVRRPVPEGCSIIAGSTPVIAFGNARTARVATLGINPSSHEFVDTKTGNLLQGDRQRVATLDSLRASSCESLTDEQVEKVVRACDNYFKLNPYRRWFDPLDKILNSGADASYFDGSACHLDLSQWATSPTWKDLARGQRDALLMDGTPHLQAQLANENIKVVVVNGRSVWDELIDNALCKLDSEQKILLGADNQTTATLFTGRGLGSHFIGWTCNVQNSRRSLSNQDKAKLADWLSSTINRIS